MKKAVYKFFFGALITMIITSQCFAVSPSEINENISIDFLNSSYVSIFRTKSVNIDGVKYQIGARDAMSFENSDSGRDLLLQNVSEPFLSAILNVWKDTEKEVSESLKLQSIPEESDVREDMSLGFLDEKSVIFLKTRYITIDNTEYMLGVPSEVLFENSEKGRQSIAQEASEPLVSVVMVVWGDSPTVESPKELNESEEIERKKIALGETSFN